MGVKKVWDKLVGTVGGVNEDDEFETDEYEDEEEMEEERAPRRTPAVAPRRSGVNYAAPQEKPLRMVIVEPETFDDSQSIADYIRDRKPVVINFESTPDDIAKRVVDFVSGATYAWTATFRRSARKSSSAYRATSPSTTASATTTAISIRRPWPGTANNNNNNGSSTPQH